MRFARCRATAHRSCFNEPAAPAIGDRRSGKVVFITGRRAVDLAETVRLVEATGSGIVAVVAHNRDLDALKSAGRQGVAQFGRFDVIVAKAGITAPEAGNRTSPEAFKT
jgi:NAD(P)-dependent dehydrogenase (short-subunit alcohol dehydrogenase family)